MENEKDIETRAEEYISELRLRYSQLIEIRILASGNKITQEELQKSEQDYRQFYSEILNDLNFARFVAGKMIQNIPEQLLAEKIEKPEKSPEKIPQIKKTQEKIISDIESIEKNGEIEWPEDLVEKNNEAQKRAIEFQEEIIFRIETTKITKETEKTPEQIITEIPPVKKPGSIKRKVDFTLPSNEVVRIGSSIATALSQLGTKPEEAKTYEEIGRIIYPGEDTKVAWRKTKDKLNIGNRLIRHTNTEIESIRPHKTGLSKHYLKVKD